MKAQGLDPVNGEAFLTQDWREKPDARASLGEAGLNSMGHPNIFPNLWITNTQLSLRLPKGPYKCEIWWFTMVPADADPKDQAKLIDLANHVFGPAGLLEQDDGENWDQSTRGMKGVVGRRHPVNFAMDLGRAPVKTDENGAAYVDTNINEHAQLWTWNAWADWMTAETWSALKAHKTPIPERL
jgi:hypothetical protein